MCFILSPFRMLLASHLSPTIAAGSIFSDTGHCNRKKGGHYTPVILAPAVGRQ
jgi:hypothetical protein